MQQDGHMRIAAPIEIGPLDADAQQAVRDLAAAAEAHDGVAPLSEQPLLNLGTDAEWITHVVAHTTSGSTIGYVQVDRSGDTASAELVIHPEHRRGGHGRMLLRTAERDATLPSRSGEPGQDGKHLRVWAHGDLEPAREFAASAGLRAVRELRFLARPLAPAEAPELPAAPAGYRLRTFRPGADDAAWLRVNAAAFASHPEQGRLTLDDLRSRQAEPWFDPEGFFLAERDGRLVGFHWTKIHRAEELGEVYVVGVAPGAQGGGLGKALTLTGLRYLAARGLPAVLLYVDADNTAAVGVYEGLGFTVHETDLMYRTET